MAAAFGIAANAFSVVGLADVVFRAGTELYDFYSRYSSASKSIPRLLSGLQSLAGVLAQCRAFLNDIRQSPEIENHEQLVHEIKRTLTECSKELNGLRLLTEKIKKDCNTGYSWLQGAKGRFNWARNDDQIVKTCQQIETHKSTLSIALSLVGRKNDISLLSLAKSTKDDVNGIRSAAEARLDGIEQTVRQDISMASSSTQSRLGKLERRVTAEVAGAHHVTQSKLGTMHTRITETRITQKSLDKNMSAMRKNLHRSQTQQASSSARILSSIERAQTALAEQIATLTLTQTSTQGTEFEGVNLEAILMPLMFMKSSLATAFQEVLSKERTNITQGESCWIRKELELLLASSHEFSAREARERADRGAYDSDSVDVTTDFRKQHGSYTKQVAYADMVRKCWRSTPTGLLLIWASQSMQSSAEGDPTESIFVQFSFVPKSELCKSGLSFVLSKKKDQASNTGYRISKHVSSFNTISRNSEVVRRLQADDVRSLRELVRSNKSLIFDRDENGRSPLHYAASFKSLQSMLLLLKSGADPNFLDWNGMSPSDIIRPEDQNTWKAWVEALAKAGYKIDLISKLYSIVPVVTTASQQILAQQDTPHPVLATPLDTKEATEEDEDDPLPISTVSAGDWLKLKRVLSTAAGRRKALLIGINYFGEKGELKGSIADAKNMTMYLIRNFGYSREDMVVLTDDQTNPYSLPTKANILMAMHWLVKDARKGDSLLFQYSGHGGTTIDIEDDENDGYDECIYPVDFKTSGHIVDDEMYRIMVQKLPPGVRLTAIFDSSHSGSALDLPYVYSTQGVQSESSTT